MSVLVSGGPANKTYGHFTDGLSFIHIVIYFKVNYINFKSHRKMTD